MYIKSIVLEGFKSYGSRVEITGFDPAFNAITGLNGTGKSNILDAICFVLGITNLSNVRATSLQELIYKHGQAGITKATVSVTFDNTKKSQQPVGYDSNEITVTRQVVMGGKNKYLINGINVQNKRVSDLFCSVQLNVNNPHFLIMQGRITKVLNMKPPEILSMVEEAAGTRMYEAKKQSAQKTIEKKDAKLAELNNIIKEDIAPKLQKLQDERAQFQEYQKVVRELENLTKVHVAWKYVSAEEKTKQAELKVQEVQDTIKSKKNGIKENEREIKDIEKQINEMSRALDEEGGTALRELETSLAALERAEAGAAAAERAARDAAAAHARRARLLDAAAAGDAQLREDKAKQLHEMTSSFASLREASEASEAALSAAQQHFLAVSSGQENAAESLQDQLMAAKQQASEASTRVLQAGMELAAGEARLRELRREFEGGAAQYRRDTATIRTHQARIQGMQEQLASMNFDTARNTALRESVRALQTQVRGARDAADALAARLQRASFHYTPPPGFDRSRVSGTVCRLFEVKDPVYCTALETVAGGKLYNVVVDTEVTSKLLLERGNLQSRTTIIPLNKIQPFVIDRRTVAAAQEIGGGSENVQLALDLITFDKSVRGAMAWVFGGTLVCRDLETAKRVTFSARVRRRCVTWDGDACDPAGTLAGGARAPGGSVLARLAELRALEAARAEAEARLAADSAALQADQKLFDDYHALQQQYELMSHELEIAQSRLATTSHAQLHAEIESLEKQIKELTEAIERDKVIQKEATERAKELEAKVKDIRSHREREFKKAEEALKRAKQEASHHTQRWKQREQELEALQLEVRELDQAVMASANQRAEMEALAAEQEEQLKVAVAEREKHSEATAAMQARIKRQKEEISRRNGAVRTLATKRDSLAAAATADALAIEELTLSVAEVKAEADKCRAEISSLERAHSWIASEKEYFGQAGGVYEWSARGAGAAGAAARLRALAERKDKLARGLNARAHTLLSKEEEQYQDLLRKKRIVEADREKLVQVMRELDEKKRVTLAAACEQVNRDFGSIFSMLLPGASARLQPPPGREVLDGLEVRVGFNGAWKESLGELSGGQRSLVALALVLAMLLFKPAPLYILDEVDAALDLSHTQNIGHMLKHHFKHSQFIIVSLKDGMFNNANVLFRTRFVDGMSSVQRTVNTRR